MQQQNKKQTSESSDSSFSKMSLRFVKEDLNEMMARIEEMKEQIRDDDIRSSLDLADQALGWAIDSMEMLEEKADELIRKIAS